VLWNELRIAPHEIVYLCFYWIRQLVFVLQKQFVAKRDKLVIGQPAAERSCLCQRKAVVALCQRDGRNLLYPLDHGELLRMDGTQYEVVLGDDARLLEQ